VTRGWTRRITLSAVLLLLVFVGLSVFSFDPDPAGLLLLGAVVAASLWLVVDAMVDLRPSWTPAAVPTASSSELDIRLATYVRMLEDHRTGSTPDSALRDRLARLADARLLERLALSRSDPEGRERLGPEVLSVIEGPARRLTVAEVDRAVRRLEEL
jgi:hypothetical protein